MLNLVPVGVSSLPLIRPTTVVSSANLIRDLEPCTGMQLCLKRENRIGLSTQPCGTPVFRVRTEEVWLLILTDCGLLVRKSRVQLQREGMMPRSMSLEISLDGITILKEELKSMNSILAYVLVLSRCVRAEWRAEAMASSVDLYDL